MSNEYLGSHSTYVKGNGYEKWHTSYDECDAAEIIERSKPKPPKEPRKEANIKAGYTYMPNSILLDTRLKVPVRAFYMMMRTLDFPDSDGNRKGWIIYGEQRLSKMFGVSIDSITRYREELVRYDYIRIEPRGNGKTRNSDKVYLLV